MVAEYAGKKNMDFHETSAKTNTEIYQAFEAVAKKIMAKKDEKLA